MKNFQKTNPPDGLGKQLYLLILPPALSFAGYQKKVSATNNDHTLTSALGIPHALIYTGTSIQAAIDAANSGRLILSNPEFTRSRQR